MNLKVVFDRPPKAAKGEPITSPTLAHSVSCREVCHSPTTIASQRSQQSIVSEILFAGCPVLAAILECALSIIASEWRRERRR
jgi:hypothetical protein